MLLITFPISNKRHILVRLYTIIKGDFMSEMLEKLSNLEHEQWCDWSKSVADDMNKLIKLIDFDKLNEDDKEYVESQIQRLERWSSYWVDYDELDDDVKEQDRVYARKVMDEI